MGSSYVYLNHDKRQYFRCGLFLASSDFSAIGNGPGGRALALLLSERGSWNGERVSAVSDTSEGWEAVHGELMNIEPEVALMLIDIDGLAWLEEKLADSNLVFSRLCALASHQRHPGIGQLLDRTFGAGNWQRRYRNYLRENTPWPWLEQVTAARDRRLNLFE